MLRCSLVRSTASSPAMSRGTGISAGSKWSTSKMLANNAFFFQKRRTRVAASSSSTFFSSFGLFFCGLSAATFCATAAYMMGGYYHQSPTFTSASCVSTIGRTETPEYLIPYYLRDTKSRFLHYASIKSTGKPKRMSPTDFLAAMLALPNDAYDDLKDDPDAATLFSDFFRWADADGDGTISYSEFAFLANILAYPLRDWKVLMRLFDEDNNGGLTPAEFVKMMDSVSATKMRPRLRSGIMRALFLPEEFQRFQKGESGPLKHWVPAKKHQHGATAPSTTQPPPATATATTTATATATTTTAPPEMRFVSDKVPPTALVTYERLSGVVQTIERKIAETEFGLADTDKKGFVSKEEFGSMLLGSIHGRHLPFFLVENMRKLGSSSSNNDDAVKLETYLLMTEMFRKADEIANALLIYVSAGYAIRAADLKRALDRCVDLSRPIEVPEAQLFVALFDATPDGDLHVEEFLKMLRSKGSYAGVLPRNRKDRKNLFARLASCTKEAVKQATAEE